MFMVRVFSESNFSYDQILDFADAGFVSAVESPFLDAFTTNQAGLRKNAQVFAGGGLAYAQFAGDQDAAHSVLHQVTVNLGREVFPRLLEPFQNLQAFWISQGAQCAVNSHIDN